MFLTYAFLILVSTYRDGHALPVCHTPNPNILPVLASIDSEGPPQTVFICASAGSNGRTIGKGELDVLGDCSA